VTEDEAQSRPVGQMDFLRSRQTRNERKSNHSNTLERFQSIDKYIYNIRHHAAKTKECHSHALDLIAITQ
jgi:hypothetical protein